MNLLHGETVDLNPKVLDTQYTADEVINEKYVRGEVRIVTEQARYPLSSIPDLLSSGHYLLRPEYQRRHRWSVAKKSRLIESLVMNVPIPPIFLYEYEFGKYEVMDGLQRLSTIRDFYRDDFNLSGLDEWSELSDRRYSTLPSSIRAGIDRRYLSSIILLQETAKDPQQAQNLKQLVFERINSGGEKLTPQESRNAIYGGAMNELCLRLSREPALCLTWGIPVPVHDDDVTEDDEELLENDLYREMFDVELVLRFFAFRQDPQHLRGVLRDYFDAYMKAANQFPSELLSALGILYKETIQLAFDLFGERAFWLWRQRNGRWNWYSRPTTVAYDTIMWVLSQRIDKGEHLRARAEHLREELPRFYEEHYEDFAGRYTNPSNIISRRELFAEWLDSASATAAP